MLGVHSSIDYAARNATETIQRAWKMLWVSHENSRMFSRTELCANVARQRNLRLFV